MKLANFEKLNRKNIEINNFKLSLQNEWKI